MTSIDIPNSVTFIGYSAFYGCIGLTSINIPNSVTTVADEAFRGCNGLISITVEDGNTVYDSRNNCNAIIKSNVNKLIVGCKNTVIPNSVTSIGDGAFRGCSGLQSVIIPNSITSIGHNVFKECNSLLTVFSFNTTPPTITGSTFNYNEQYCELKVPLGYKHVYANAPYWGRFDYISEITEDISAIDAKDITQNNDDVTVTNLEGQRFIIKSNQINSLPKGIYIINGRKYSVK